MAKKEKTVRLVLSEDGTYWIPVDAKFTTLTVARPASFVSTLPGLNVAFGSGPNLADYSVPLAVYNVPEVEGSEDAKNNKYYIDAPLSVLSKFNPLYAPKESLLKPTKDPTKNSEELTIGEKISAIKGVEFPREEIASLGKNEFKQKLANALKASTDAQQPEAIFQSKLYTYDELMLPETGAALVNNEPTNPASREEFSINLPGEFGELTTTPAVLLPALGYLGGRPQDSYYVAPLGEAVEQTIKNFVANSSIVELKQSLLNSGYMSVDDYNLSTGTVNELIADSTTKTAVLNALVDLSANSFQRLREGQKNLLDFDDWLISNKTSERAVSQVTLPGAGALKQILDNQYETYYGRKATMDEFVEFQNQVTESAIQNAQRTFTEITPEGRAVDVTTAGFSVEDMSRLAASLTEGTEEREQFYGAKRLNRLMMQAYSQNFGSGQESLEQQLR